MKMNQRKKAIKTIAIGLIAIVSLGCASITAGASTPSRIEDKYNTPASLWTVDAGLSITENCDIPHAAKQGYRWGKEITENDLEPWEKNGVKISSETEVGYAYFSNIIDINGFTKNDHLLELIPLTSLRGTSDFSSIRVLLTDADNETNWLSVTFSAVSLKYSVGSSYVSVETSSGAKGGKRWGYESSEMYTSTEIHTGGFYNTVKPIEGKTVDEMAAVPYSLIYDVETNTIYSRHRDGGLAYIFDLDDDSQTGIGKTWSGFTNNRVKLSLQLRSISSAPASLIVLNVANNPMNGTEFVDYTAPSSFVNLPNNEIPHGIVGKEYKIFPAEFYDFYNGILEYQVSLKGPYDVDYENLDLESFTPMFAGTYKLLYTATDFSGNKSGIVYDIEVFNAIPSIKICVEDYESNIIVGEKVVLPKVQATGGSGQLELSTKIVRVSDNKIIGIQGNEFVPLFAGEYDITYTFTDYLGNVATETITISAISSKKPVLKSELVMYEKFTDGVAVELPKVNAFDYDTLPGQVLNAKTEITVKGTGSKSGYSEKLVDNVFTPTKEKFGEKVLIEYKVYCAAYESNALYLPVYEVSIINLNDIENLFNYDPTNVLLESNSKEDKEKFVRMTALSTGTAITRFMNPLQAEGFEFLFAVEQNRDKFDSIQLILTDFFDSRIQLQISIEKWNESNTYVYYENHKKAMSGGFGSETPLLLRYNSNIGIVDYTGEVLFSASELLEFPSGRVWATIVLENAITDAAIQLKTIGTQILSARYNSKGKVAFSDVLSPTLELTESIKSEVELGATVCIPPVKVYDVCRPYLEAYYTLTAPNGDILANKEKLGTGATFVAASYGEYKLSYIANDGSNEGVLQISIFVSDYTAPVIFYNGKDEIEGCVGEVLKAKHVEVYDAYDGKLNAYVFVIDPNGKICEITNVMEFKFLTKGKHILRYYAYDANYNYNIKDIVVWVK